MDPRTGESRQIAKCGFECEYGLAWNGEHLVTATPNGKSRTGAAELYFRDPASGQVLRKATLNHDIRELCFSQGSYFLLGNPLWSKWKHPAVYKVTF